VTGVTVTALPVTAGVLQSMVVGSSSLSVAPFARVMTWLPSDWVITPGRLAAGLAAGLGLTGGAAVALGAGLGDLGAGLAGVGGVLGVGLGVPAVAVGVAVAAAVELVRVAAVVSQALRARARPRPRRAAAGRAIAARPPGRVCLPLRFVISKRGYPRILGAKHWIGPERLRPCTGNSSRERRKTGTISLRPAAVAGAVPDPGPAVRLRHLAASGSGTTLRRRLRQLHGNSRKGRLLPGRWGPSLTAMALLVALLAGFEPAAGAATPATTTVGTPPALPAGATLQGAVAAGTRVDLTVALQPADPAALSAMATAVSTPGSPYYRHYLTTAEFAQQYGASQTNIQSVLSTLGGLGLNGGTVSANNLTISYTTTAAVAQSAFATPIRDTILRDGTTAYANTAAPRVPVTIAPAIQAIAGLDTLPVASTNIALPTRPPGSAPASGVRAQAAGAQASGPTACSAASTTASNDMAYVPAQLASTYGLTGLYGLGSLGAGQTVGLFELSEYTSSDIAAYQTCFGTSASVTNEIVSPPNTFNGDVEDVLDVETVIGLAPKANITVYEGFNSNSGILSTYTRIATDNTAKIVSTSWDSCEPDITSGIAGSEATEFQNMAMQGQTVFAASGDQGSEACDADNPPNPQLAVDDPASQPYVTGVGGTTLSSPGTPPSESVWNNSSGATGGGLSIYWAKPGWQAGTGVSNGFSNGEREVPDVSASGDPNRGYIIYYTDTGGGTGFSGWQAIGGTSAATPLWAALIALTNETCGAPVGFLNTKLYPAAGTGSFNDITSGNNDYTGTQGGDYPATAGYDLSTGLGTPFASNGGNGGLFAQLCPASPAFTADSPPETANTTSAYSYTFIATGRPAPTFSVSSGSLPPGLSLNGTTGVLSGTPTAGGVYTFQVTASGSGSPATSPTLTITVDQPPTFTADSPPGTAATNVAYSYQFAASGYPAPTFSVATGSVPTGTTLSSSGLLNGVPSVIGTYTFKVTANNGVSPSATTPTLTVLVAAQQPPALTADTPPSPATVGTPYSYTFTASGNPSPRFSLSGTAPPGLTVNGITGVLSGTPTTAGSFSFTVSASNGVNPAATSPTLTIAVQQAPALTAASPPTGATVGSAYSYTFTASGTPAPTFAVAGGSLPPGLSLSAASGALAGTPTAAGAYTFTVSAANGVGAAAVSASISITVGQGPAFTADAPFPGGTVGHPYVYVFGASGSPAPTFSVVAGSLPPGLVLYADGLLAGTPTTPGTFVFSIEAANGQGTAVVSPALAITVTYPARTGLGYWEVASDGGLFSYGNATFFGSTGGMPINKPIVGMAATPDDQGYWEVASDGGLFSYGNATFYGSMGGKPLNKPIVGMVATPDGKGYWEVASDGGLFSFGDATFFGSTGGMTLNKPIVGMVVTPDARGYWEVASDGGLFSYGDAGFYGSVGGKPLNSSIVSMVASPDGRGYWEVASDGGLFSFGDATFLGSIGGHPLNKPIVGMVATPDGRGYWEVASDGGLFSYGDATFYGSTGGMTLNKPIVGMFGT
jgi:hypothetical protein